MPSEAPETPTDNELEHRLATILAVDVVGYSRLMGDDPNATVSDLEAVRTIVRGLTVNHGGYIADTAGDSIIAVFDTAVGAIFASCAAQREISERAQSQSENRQMLLRMGIHRGDILQKRDGTVYGDGVNIAARLESLAPPGGVTVSEEARIASGASENFKFLDQGEFEVKNISHPVRVHLVAQEGGPDHLALAQNMQQRVTKGNLPVRTTELIGRADALDELATLLETSRLVTLFGMGGLGKTSLSIEVGRITGFKYPDGVWFADLGAVVDGSAVGLALAGVFSVTQQSGKTIEASLVEALRGRRMLLILDNCEHVLRSAATLADSILTACPKISIVTTSRELLSINGETVMPVTPLEIGGNSAPAIELFTQRAQAVSPGFRIAGHEKDVQAICEELDGIPLAIELAAARVKSMTPGQIHARLDKRFRLLTGGSKVDLKERHQTLQNVVQWSFDLLNETEMTVFNRATTFAGGFTLEAAETVCAGGDVDEFDVVDALDSLVAKSLLIVRQREDGLRYRMLETIRSFGAERLENGPDYHSTHLSHARFFAAQSDANFQLWRSPKERDAYVWLDKEINNLRKAFRWSKDNGEIDSAARIASSVGDMGRFRLREEAAGWAEEIVDQARDAKHPRLIILLTWSASSAWAFSRFDDAQRFGDEALSLLDDDAFDPFVWAYGDLAFVSIFSGDVARAIELLSIGAKHPADAHDRFMMAFHLFIMATAGFADDARKIADDVVRKVDMAGVPMAMAVAHAARGASIEAQNPMAAQEEYERGIEIASNSGARFMETLIAPRLAALHAHSGDLTAALQGFEHLLSSYGDAADMASVSAWHTSLVVLFARTGQFLAAATLHGTLVGLIDQGSLVPEHKDAVQKIRNALGVKSFSTATENGAIMSLREATNYAISQIQLGLGAENLTASS